MSSKDKKAQSETEIMMDGLDQLLDEFDSLITARPTTSDPSMIPSNDSMDRYAVSLDNEQLMPTQTSTLDIDELLAEIVDPSSIATLPTASEIKKPSEPVIFSCQHEFRGDRAGAGFFAQQKFCDALKTEIKKNYSVETTVTRTDDKSELQVLIYIIEFKSTDETKTREARDSLKALWNTMEVKLVDEQAGFWTKESDCQRIIQAYSDQNESLQILCEYEAIGYLMISYFNKDKSTVLPNLCTNDATLSKIIQEKFLSCDISLPSTSDLTKDNKSHLAQDILKLESEMRSKAILMILEPRRVRLFGLSDLVKEVAKQIEEIKRKYESDTVKLSLEPKQIQYLLDIYNDELKTLETTYQNAKICEPLKNGEFTAPSFLHDKIEPTIMAMATLCTPVHFEIQDQAFHVIAHAEHPNLIRISRQYKCQIEIQENTTNHICQIPKATTQDHISNKLTATAIKIHKDDLAEQKVDLVVVCWTSLFLREDILEKAGSSVREEYNEAVKLSPSKPFETNSGQLKCRRLLFLPWTPDQTNQDAFYQSIRNFVTKAVQHAIKAHHTSIAFPSIGCGQFNIDKNIVANEMLVEAQKQLLRANVLLQIIFVILPDQSNVYEVFQAKLENLKKGNLEIKDTQIPYKLTTLAITIISSNTEKQEECKKALDDYVKKSASTLELLQQDVLKKWTQPAINEFYTFCLSRDVILDMNITIGYLKLFGSKELVQEAKVEYYRIQTKQSEHARLAVIARDIIWAYKVDDNTSEKYSPELNVRIEDAHSNNMPTFIYTNDQSEEYTIDFKTMTETCTNKLASRQVIRHADFNLPENWEVQSENVAQFNVKDDSTEYQEIRALFDTTMANKYAEILRIERIQNKPWFMQYNSYKSFSPKKNTEKKLFHGCPQDSAKLIMHSFFNRSFAGINGTVYGQGAYFSSNASYSNHYAKASTLNGERRMFVANVLVGDSIQGNTSMKTPPSGYESTTDGNHIFVTYRDDQAYAVYLIIYK